MKGIISRAFDVEVLCIGVADTKKNKFGKDYPPAKDEGNY